MHDTELMLRRPRLDEEQEVMRAYDTTAPEVPDFLHYYAEGMSFARYLEVLEEQERGIGLPTPHHVPSTFLLAFRGDRVVGRTSIRHRLNERLSSDIDVVASCLKDGADPHAFAAGDPDDVRALAVHAFEGRVDIVRLLLSSGSNPNLGRASTGETPLHHAVCGRIELDVVRALLQAGADPDAKCQTGVLSDDFMRDVRVRGETPLHRAAAYAEASVIEALLAAGAEVESTDAHGDSALSWASLHRRDRSILKLVSFGHHRV